MILVIDNYDSFVYNLARYIDLGGKTTRIVRNDATSLQDIAAQKPAAIVISPGPCTPKESGISTGLIRKFGSTIPILGVCLGHQCIGEAYGGETIRADKPVHGKADTITHDGTKLFADIPNPMRVGRYHSLICDLSKAQDLDIIASNEAQIPMAVAHKTHPVFGVQFHPESILTEHGQTLVNNFLRIAKAWNAKPAKIAA